MATARQHFMMAATAAQVTRPAGVAGLLLMHVALAEPDCLFAVIDASIKCAHSALFIINKAVAGR